MAYQISDEMYEKLSNCVMGKRGSDLITTAGELVAGAKRTIEGLCYTEDDWRGPIEAVGPEDMTEAERAWLRKQLSEVGFEGSFVTDAIKDEMESEVEALRQELVEQRKAARKRRRKK